MAVEAPASRFKRNNLLLFMIICIALAGWFGYDGYFNEGFQEKHTKENGEPDSTLVFNRKSPPFFLAGAALFGVYLLVIRKRKLVADDEHLILSNGEKVPYSSVQKVDKTYFESKGVFKFTYIDANGKEKEIKLSDRKFDNLSPVLERLVAKIS